MLKWNISMHSRYQTKIQKLKKSWKKFVMVTHQFFFNFSFEKGILPFQSFLHFSHGSLFPTYFAIRHHIPLSKRWNPSMLLWSPSENSPRTARASWTSARSPIKKVDIYSSLSHFLHNFFFKTLKKKNRFFMKNLLHFCPLSKWFLYVL